MKSKNKFLLPLILITLLFFSILTGCEEKIATIDEITMTNEVDSDGKNLDSVQSYNDRKDEFIIVTLISNAPKDTKIEFKWFYKEKNEFIDSATVFTDGTRYVYSTLSKPNNGWPAGEYEVKVYLNSKDTPDKTINFNVRSTQTAVNDLDSNDNSDSEKNSNINTNSKEFEAESLDIVQNGSFDEFSTTTVKDAFEKFFTSVNWLYYQNDQNMNIVEFKGAAVYENRRSYFSVFFEVDVTERRFLVTRVTENDEDMTFEQLSDFLGLVLQPHRNVAISTVTEGTFGAIGNTLIGETFNKFFNDPLWNYFQTPDGSHLVSFMGQFDDMGTIKTAFMEFTVDVENKTFEMSYVDIDGVQIFEEEIYQFLLSVYSVNSTNE